MTREAAVITLLAAVSLPALPACAQVAVSQAAAAHNTLTERERAEGWRLLFDGRTTEGWRNFRGQGLRDGWQVVDGTLSRVGPGGDIVTVDQYDSFELTLDWKIERRGNSGVFFHVQETSGSVWHTGPEMQILDDDAHPDGRTPLTSVGSNYALHAPSSKAANPIGEWNSARLIVRGRQVEQWLNGTRVVQYELGSPEWERLVAASKFSEHAGYGRAGRGHIALQDHGDPVSFRNIKIRPLR
jgi:hypothetical protein